MTKKTAKKEKRKPRTIFVQLKMTGDLVQVFYGNDVLQDKYGPGVLNNIYRNNSRFRKSGISIKGCLWAKLPYNEYSKKTTQEKAIAAKEQVQDLVLRHCFLQLTGEDVRKKFNVEEIEALLQILKPKVKDFND